MGMQYASNITLVDNSQDQVNTAGLELAPGVYASYASDRLTAALDYSLISRTWQNSAFNDLAQSLEANGTWAVAEDLLYMSAEAGYDDAVINPSAGLNYGNQGFFGLSNLAERATASVSPTLRKRFNDFEAIASFKYARVWYLDSGAGTSSTPGFFTDDDSVDKDAKISFGTTRTASKIFGRIFYESQRTEYSRSLPYRNERAGVDGGYSFLRTLAVVGEAGRESSLDQSTTAGAFGSNFWTAGLRWAPNRSSSAELRFGHRFFGRTYFAVITHQARFLSFDASYTESPQVESRLLSSDQFEPGNLPTSIPPGLDFGLINSAPYVSKDMRLGITARGSRTTIRLSSYQSKRAYLRQTLGNEQGSGVTLSASRRLAPNTTIDLSADYAEYQRTISTLELVGATAARSNDTQFLARANRSFGPRVTASLEAGLLNRTGDTTYDGWWLGLRGRWSPAAH